MPLRQWSTNNDKLRFQIQRNFENYTVPKTTPILSLQWNTEEDTLALKPVELASLEQNPMTKRQLLSNVSKLFDPLGLFAPITIKGRILLQES